MFRSNFTVFPPTENTQPSLVTNGEQKMSTAWFLINAELRPFGKEIATVSEDEHCLIYAVAVNLAEEEIETVNSESLFFKAA